MSATNVYELFVVNPSCTGQHDRVTDLAALGRPVRTACPRPPAPRPAWGPSSGRPGQQAGQERRRPGQGTRARSAGRPAGWNLGQFHRLLESLAGESRWLSDMFHRLECRRPEFDPLWLILGLNYKTQRYCIIYIYIFIR